MTGRPWFRMPTARRGNKETTKQPTLTKKRYATYLRPETIKRLRRYAVDHELPDYQVVQKAIDDFLTDAA